MKIKKVKLSPRQKEHRKLRHHISRAELLRIVNASNPTDAAKWVLTKYGVKEACAVIDSLDELTAAFVIFAFKSGADELKTHKKKVHAILHRGKHLKIKGLKGLCHARDTVYRKTGVFVV